LWVTVFVDFDSRRRLKYIKNVYAVNRRHGPIFDQCISR
jgi:hypothetical protein